MGEGAVSTESAVLRQALHERFSLLKAGANLTGMKTLKPAAVHLAAPPLSSKVARTPTCEVVLAATGFMNAIGSDDETGFTELMIPAGVIFVHNHMIPDRGAFRFSLNAMASHCGINSLSIVKREIGWKVGNTPFTTLPVDQSQAAGRQWIMEAGQ
jgi:hypothetical protein